MKVGVGCVTFNRPDYLKQVVEGWRNIAEAVDVFAIINDGSTAQQPMLDDYLAVYETLPVHCKLFHPPENQGVAAAKNRLFCYLLGEGCDWIFIQEDDFVTVDRLAVTGYIRAAEAAGMGHLMFHVRGDMNRAALGSNGGTVTFWHDYLAGWCLYSRDSLLRCGLMDEHFHNAWEHIEHTLRLAKGGYTQRWRAAADAAGSERWVKEIPGSTERSAIRVQQAWPRWMEDGKRYWQSIDPYTYAQVFA